MDEIFGLGVLTWIIGILFWAVIWGVLTDVVGRNRGYGRSCFWMGFFLGLIGFLIALCSRDRTRDEMYANSKQQVEVITQSQPVTASDELLKLKQLYGAGAITQAEYEEKRTKFVDKL